MLSQVALWALVLLPAVAGVALLLAGGPANRAAAAVGVGAAAVVAVLAVVVAVAEPTVAVPFVAGADFGLAVDGLAALVVVPVAVITLLVLIFAAVDIHEAPARFHGLMLLFSAAVLVTVTATNLVTLLVAWEIMGATSYALIGFHWRSAEKMAAGETAFVTTRAADLGLYAAAAAALVGGSGWALADLPAASEGWRQVAAAGILIAALGKAAQLPFSFWLSRAMAGPSPVSALLHSAAMVAMGGYLLLRTAPLLAATGWAATVAAWAGALTALLLGLVAVAQRDFKQLLAASTAAQLGFVVLAAGLSAVAGGTAHLIAHAATKALLFLVAGAWLSALGTKQLAALRGAARRWPVVGVCAGIGALALGGIPPLSLWATKDEILVAAQQSSLPLYLVGLAAALLAAAYAGKLVIMLLAPAPAGVEDGYDTEEAGTRRIPAPMIPPLVVLAVGAVALVVLALPPIIESVRAAVGEAPAPVDWTSLAIAGGLSIVTMGLVVRFGLPELRWLAGWLGLEQATRVLVVRPVERLAGALARFDDRWVDGAVTATARAGLATARRSARFDDDVVDGSVEGLAGGARRLGTLARRPQTGQLHQYYAQAVVGLVALAVLAAVSVLFVIGR